MVSFMIYMPNELIMFRKITALSLAVTTPVRIIFLFITKKCEKCPYSLYD